MWNAVFDCIREKRTLTVSTPSYSPRERDTIDRILGAFLVQAGMKGLKNKLTYCIHELAGNAKKANTKRIYFREKGLDIHDPGDYQEGMRGFKAETAERLAHYLERMKEEAMYIKFQVRLTGNGIRVWIRNNAELLPIEKTRIEEKLKAARAHECVADAYSLVEDGSEGAGLGIVMMVFMLANMGFGADALRIASRHGETVALLDLRNDAAARRADTA